MNVFISYDYDAHTTATYFELALAKRHAVYYVGPPWRERPGRARNEDLSALVDAGALPRPDLVLFIDSGHKSFPRGFEKLPCPTACYLIDVHQGLHFRQHVARFFDHIFLCHKDYLDQFEHFGRDRVHWLPVACDPDVHGDLEVDREFDVAFVGGIGANPERKRLLHALESAYRMNDYRRYHPKEEITQSYSRAKIVFNYAINKDLNMRVFEAMASGALLVTNHMDNGMADLFREGEHFVEYADQASLFQKLDYYLAHDAERVRVATAAKNLVTELHTYERRSQTMLEVIFSAKNTAGRAAVRSMTGAELRRAYGRVYAGMGLVDAAMDELGTAWSQKSGRRSAAAGVTLTVLRRMNEVTRLSRLLGRGRRNT